MLFIKLILAHLIGDFILQPSSWVAGKERKKTKSLYLYIHVLLHFALLMVALWNIELWWMAASIAVSHGIIDAAKLHFQKNYTKRFWFFLDQFLHVLVLGAAVLYLFPDSLDALSYFGEQYLPLVAGIIFLTIPASVIIKMLISLWTPVVIEHSKVQTESLVNAGKYIGILERILVFIFIIVNHWEGVGFMIAAKSVFRFSDLAEAKQRKLTEYVLIGTLLSFGVAIVTGILVSTVM